MTTVVIPSRMASSRFPGKPLASISGLPLIEHVRRRAALTPDINDVVVATCDEEIRAVVEANGGRVLMTKDSHERCTDRVEEAMDSLSDDIVVMVQGDEPLLLPETIAQVARPLLEDRTLGAVNLLSRVESPDDYQNPNIVKAVCDRQDNIIFMTRAAVPYFRKQVEVPVYRQTGIIAFTTPLLRKYSQLAETSLEQAESVDMLRLIEHGIRLAGVVTSETTIGVDHPEDVALVENVLRSDRRQRELFDLIVAGR